MDIVDVRQMRISRISTDRKENYINLVSKKIKISIANRGSNNGMFGKPMPLNTKTAIIIAVSKPVLQLDSNDNIINRFSSASEAERHLNGKGSHISCCCLGKRKTAYGYRWKYE